MGEQDKSAYEQLNNKQRAFVETYIACNFNATRAARMVGYAQPNMAGPRMILNDSIAAAVKERISEIAMSADEVLRRYANYARFDVSEFVRVPVYGPMSLADEQDDDPVADKKARTVDPYVDVLALIEAGQGFAIKGVKQTPSGANIEFHDPVAALQALGKHLGVLSDKVTNLNIDLDKLADMSDEELDKLEKALGKGGRIHNLVS